MKSSVHTKEGEIYYASAKEGRFYFSFSFEPNKISVALLSQVKLLDTKRLYSKIGRIRKDDLVEMKRKFYELTN